MRTTFPPYYTHVWNALVNKLGSVIIIIITIIIILFYVRIFTWLAICHERCYFFIIIRKNRENNLVVFCFFKFSQIETFNFVNLVLSFTFVIHFCSNFVFFCFLYRYWIANLVFRCEILRRRSLQTRRGIDQVRPVSPPPFLVVVVSYFTCSHRFIASV